MNILDKIVIGGNTAITLLGDGFNLKIGQRLLDSKGISHKILSIAMVEHEDPKDITKSTTVLVEGDWKE